MTQRNLTYFTLDRFGNENSALALNGGWTQVPSGVYFNTPEFTISVWVYPRQVGSYSRIIDFGNGNSSDNILLALSESNSLMPILQIYSGPNILISAISRQNLTLNNWQLVTATFDGTNSRIYLNGNLTVESDQEFNLTYIERPNCYIGKSNLNSILDDLRFYNKSLTQKEIEDLMLLNETSKKCLSQL